MTAKSMYVYCHYCKRHVRRTQFVTHYNKYHEPVGRKVVHRDNPEYYAAPTAFDRR